MPYCIKVFDRGEEKISLQLFCEFYQVFIFSLSYNFNATIIFCKNNAPQLEFSSESFYIRQIIISQTLASYSTFYSFYHTTIVYQLKTFVNLYRQEIH